MSWPTSYPPRDLPGGDFAIIRSDGALRRWDGYLWRWVDQRGMHAWQCACPLPDESSGGDQAGG